MKPRNLDDELLPPIYVYRIQNSKGNGVYRPEETSKKNIKSPYGDHEAVSAIDMLARNFHPFRYPPQEISNLSKAELKLFLSGQYLSCFSSLAQLTAWFPFYGELSVLSDYGYEIYRVRARKIVSVDNQAIFVPYCTVGKCSELLTPEMISEEEFSLVQNIKAERKKMMLGVINKIKPGSYYDKKYFQDDELKEEIISLIKE